MTPTDNPRTAQPVFDATWLAACDEEELDAAGGIRLLRLTDTQTGTVWIGRSALLGDAPACEHLQREARASSRLAADWAAVPVATLWTPDRLMLVYGAEGGALPASALARPMPVASFLALAAGAARTLASLHGQHLTHGDLRPGNLLADRHHHVRLVGQVFPDDPVAGRSSVSRPYEAPERGLGELAGATIATDLYALGVTLHELLTGELPLSGHSLASWQHAHAAIEPLPAPARRPGVPDTLGRILVKLMAKEPQARYTSAASLLADLQRCRDEWAAIGTVEHFELDTEGLLATCQVSGRLFGRARDMEVLAEALDRVKVSGVPELVLVSGAAGGGKSALARWLLARARAQGFRVADGKSDHLQRAIPLAPVAQVVRTLIAGLLGEDDAALARVRQRWLDALSGQGKAVAELVPEVEHVLGKTHSLSEVPATHGQARMEGALLQTFAAFAERGLPVVVFLDDLQWADAATLSLLEAFVVQAPENLLVIGAHRDSDASVARRLGELQHARRSHALTVTELGLAPLAESQVVDLVAAALGAPHDAATPVAQAIHRRTGGNPFFSYQLLQTWIDDGVLVRCATSTAWQWHDAAAAAQGQYTEHVVDLMIRRFARLPRAGTQLLKHAACIGIRCDEALLAKVAGRSVLHVRETLAPFVEAGLLIREPAGYAFQHDRVLESGYSLIDPAARPAAHALVARTMIAHWQHSLPEYAFEICNQIERAADHPLASEDRVLYVGALLEAGRRARSTSVIDRASAYVQAASGLMDASWWTSRFTLAYGVGILRCECLLAQADMHGASREIESLLSRPMPPLERAAVHRLEATLQTVRSDYEGAIEAALRGLALLDVQLQRHPDPEALRAAYRLVKDALGDRPIASLGELPETTDPRVQTVMGLLSTLISSVFISDGISFLHLAKMVELTLAHGATAASPYGFSWFGVFIASLFDEYEDGLAYGNAAMALIDRHGFDAASIATHLAIDQVAVWTRPLDYSLAHAQSAVTKGVASGDVGMACYAWNHIVSDMLVKGDALPLVDEAIERGLALTRAIQYLDIELILASQQHVVQLVRQGTGHGLPGDWTAAVTHRAERSNSLPTRFWVWLYGGVAAVYLGDWQQAAEFLDRARTLTWSAPAHINVSDCHLYRALALAHAPDGTGHGVALATLEDEQRRFGRWASLNPATFQSKLLLIEAELARVRGDTIKALVNYERSATAAAAAGFVHEQALAHELAHRLCHAHGLDTAGRQHGRLAHASYARWGAEHKARGLAPGRDDGAHAGTDDAQRTLPTWELGIKAAQALSEEVVMERLIETLMTNILVHARAHYGLLLLMRDDKPVIEASGRVVGTQVDVTLRAAAPNEQLIPLAVLNSVVRTRQALVLADAAADAWSLRTRRDGTAPLRSVLCLPLLRGGTLVGAIYLENNLAAGVFDEARVAQLELMSPQVAIALETARLYQQVIDEGTRRLTAEVSLRTARAELVKSSHLTLLANLSASIAHEVNQPLASIVTSADASLRWLNRPRPDTAEVEAGLQSIRQEGLRAANIIRALRTLAKQAPSHLLPLQVDDVVRDVLAMVRVDIDERGVTLSSHLAAASWVDADRIQLQQVILNLLTNALDAMDGTAVARKALSVSTSVAAAQVLVRVADRGPGIPDDSLPRIFDPFFTTKADGLGMGLAICRTIVEAHGGTLHAAPADDGGTAFECRLPLSSSATG